MRWLGLRIDGETTCAPITDTSTSATGLPSTSTSTVPTTVMRGARRVPRWSSGARAGAGAAPPAAGAGVDRPGSRGGCRRVVGDDADLAARECRVGLDPVDQRGAARGRRKQPLERDHRRSLPGDDVEGAQRLGIRERLGLGEIGAILEDMEVFWRSDENRRHCLTV